MVAWTRQRAGCRSPGITGLGHDVYEIDTRMAGYQGITAGYLILGDRPCLVETGTAPSAPVVRDALAALGVGPHDLATVVVTHIHLDHAGGAGDIAAMFPDAEVVVHERGARHLADPARLMSSARMVYGDALDTLFGTMNPTPAERIRTRGGTRDRGPRRRPPAGQPLLARARQAPRRADRLGERRPVRGRRGRGVHPGDRRTCGRPPRRRTSIWTRRWGRCACSPRCARSGCCSATTGRCADVEETLARSAEEIQLWVEETRAARGAGLDFDHTVALVHQRTRERYAALGPDADPALAAKFETLSSTASSVGRHRGTGWTSSPAILTASPLVSCPFRIAKRLTGGTPSTESPTSSPGVTSAPRATFPGGAVCTGELSSHR